MEPLKFDTRKRVVFFSIIGLVAVLGLFLIFYQGDPVDMDSVSDVSYDVGVLAVHPDAEVREVEGSKVKALSESGTQKRKKPVGDINDAWEALLNSDGTEKVSEDDLMAALRERSERDTGLSDEELLRKYFGEEFMDSDDGKKAEAPKRASRVSSGVSSAVSSGSGSRSSSGGTKYVKDGSTTLRIDSPVDISGIYDDEKTENSVKNGTVSDALASQEEDAAEDAVLEESVSVVHSMRSEMRKGAAGSSASSAAARKRAAAAVASSSAVVRCQFVRDETLGSGDRVTVRLLDPLVADGITVPANTRLVGNVVLGARLNILFSGYQADGHLYPLSHCAYDTDGQRGIFTTSSSQRARQAKDEAVNDAMNVVGTVATGVGGIIGRAASSAVNVGRTLLRGGEEKASVPSGYVFYIMVDKG